MYKYSEPKPIIINLCDERGFELRQAAADYIQQNQNITGAERGSKSQQGFGALAEIVIRDLLGMPLINPKEHPVAYDILLSEKVKSDVKCRGGSKPFQELYENEDGIPREAKHNFFARQIYDETLDTDIYILTHLETPSSDELPGTKRQKKWKLYVCGWVSKKRVLTDGVYLPRHSLTEQGNTWFTYRGQEIEFYNKNLNGLSKIQDLLSIEDGDVKEDEKRTGDLNITNVDALRIGYDLLGRGFINKSQLDYIKNMTKTGDSVKPILSQNQYHHILKWLIKEGQLDVNDLEKFNSKFPEIPFDGI